MNNTINSNNVNSLSIPLNDKKPKKKVRKAETLIRAIDRRVVTHDHAMSILSKERYLRTKLENRTLANFLTERYEYFKKIKNSGEVQKLEKIVGVLNLELFKPGISIIRFGEEGDKFYFLINGSVCLYKPISVQKELMVKEYVDLMYDIKTKERDILKFNRIIEKNAHLNLDLDIYFHMDRDTDGYIWNRKLTFFIEEDQKLGEFGSGFAFGEIALMKRCTRNATIKAKSECSLASINKGDYNRMMRELDEKRLEREFLEYKRDYPLFETWTANQMIRLFNCLSIKTIMQGEYLYRQNEDSNSIYIIREGVFEMYSMVSYGWINDFLSYIISAKNNIVHLLDKENKQFKETKLREFFDLILKHTEHSPCLYDPLKVNKIITSIKKKENLVNIKLGEEDINDPFNLFKILIRVIDYKDVIGFEDALELKKRFCFVKCISPHGKVQEISLYDFFRLLNLNIEKSGNKILLDLIANKKRILYEKLIRAARQRGEEIECFLDYKYNKYIEEEGNWSKKEAMIVEKIRDRKNFEINLNWMELKEKNKSLNKIKNTFKDKHNKTLSSGNISVNISLLNSKIKAKNKNKILKEKNISKWNSPITMRFPKLSPNSHVIKTSFSQNGIFDNNNNRNKNNKESDFSGYKKIVNTMMSTTSNQRKFSHFHSLSNNFASIDGEKEINNIKGSMINIKKNNRKSKCLLSTDFGNLISIKKNGVNKKDNKENKEIMIEKTEGSYLDINQFYNNKKLFLMKNYYPAFLNKKISKKEY